MNYLLFCKTIQCIFEIIINFIIMKKFITLVTLISMCNLGFTQMTTIYEGGINTSDSLYTDFISQGSALISSSQTPDTLPHSILLLNDGNYGVNGIYKNWDKAIYHLFKSVPEISNYGYINYYINYTLSDPNMQLSILTSDSLGLKTSSTPGYCGNLVETSPSTMLAIADTNFFQDSIIKIQVDMPFHIDSVHININYIRIDVDLSSYMMFATNVDGLASDEEFSVFSSNHNINIVNASNNPYQVSVFNLNGQEIYQGNTSGNLTIPLETNSNGIYLVRIINNKGDVVSKKLYIN